MKFTCEDSYQILVFLLCIPKIMTRIQRKGITHLRESFPDIEIAARKYDRDCSVLQNSKLIILSREISLVKDNCIAVPNNSSTFQFVHDLFKESRVMRRSRMKQNAQWQ